MEAIASETRRRKLMTFSVDPNDYDRLSALATEQQTSASHLVRQAVRNWLEPKEAGSTSAERNSER
jgi:hypothetical protein